MENLNYRVLYEYEFYSGTSAAEMDRRINNVYVEATVKENTVSFRFQRFRFGDFDPWTTGDTPYFPDFALTDYHFYPNLDIFLHDIQFQ